MFREYMKARLAVFLAVLVLPGALFAAECLNAIQATADPVLYPDNTGYATMIQADKGQGSIDCSDFIGDNGPMSQVESPNIIVTGGVNNKGRTGTVEQPLQWETNDVSDPTTFIKMAFISNGGDGFRCSEFYTKNATAGNIGSGSKANKPSNYVFCTEGVPEELPEPIVPPTPPDITGAGCPEEFQGVIDLSDDYNVLIAYGPDDSPGVPGTTVCVKANLNQPADGGNLLAANVEEPELNRCVNRCVTPDQATAGPDWIPFNDDERELPGGICTGSGPLLDGRFPIECRVCELTAIVDSDFFEPELPFCWEQGQDVQIGTTDPKGDPNPFPNTFKLPPPDQGNQAWTVNGKFGSICYLISGRTRSGYPYSYWAPSGCPN